MTNGAIYCNRCGVQNSALAKFCANCGTPFANESQPPPPPAAEVVPRAQGPVSTPPALVSKVPSAGWSVPPAVFFGGFWIRLLAFLIDALVVAIIVWPVSGLLALAIGVAGGAVMMPTMGVHLVRGIVGFAFSTCANWIYEAAMESSTKQATLGKMALTLKVTDLEGRRISFPRATGRHFAKILSGMMLLIGYVMAGFTERKQALHDMIAGTLVIRMQ
jgi:uncharacterized RDD family membrane protein YckC